jgi:hypothetical protein
VNFAGAKLSQIQESALDISALSEYPHLIWTQERQFRLNGGTANLWATGGWWKARATLC